MTDYDYEPWIPKKQPCTNCNTTETEGQWWYLREYGGIHGYFCPECYEKVSHDSYGKPRHPEEYKAVLVAQMIRKSNNKEN